MTSLPLAASEEGRSVDAFLGGLVTLVQPKRGHRAGLDAALLQALIPASATGLAVDLGAGVGTVGFCLAARAPGLSAVGVERDPDLVACGMEALARQENAAFAGRAKLIAADAADMRALAAAVAGEADWVLMNPPFDRQGRGTQSADRRRREAYVGTDDLLEIWAGTATALLKPGGALGLIHRADALRQVLDALAGHFGGAHILPVHPFATAAASRILLVAHRGSRAPPAIAPGLVLHQPDGAWTPHADAILRGRAELAI